MKRNAPNYAAMRRYVNEHPICELCGSRKCVECHHVLPMVMEGYGLDFDVPDNYITVCKKCHALLTPHSLLIKYGNEKNRWNGDFLDQIRWRFYNDIGKKLDDGEYIEADDLFDVFDKVISDFAGRLDAKAEAV